MVISNSRWSDGVMDDDYPCPYRRPGLSGAGLAWTQYKQDFTHTIASHLNPCVHGSLPQQSISSQQFSLLLPDTTDSITAIGVVRTPHYLDSSPVDPEAAISWPVVTCPIMHRVRDDAYRVHQIANTRIAEMEESTGANTSAGV